MYIGINFSKTDVSVAAINFEDSSVIIKECSTPIKINIDENFAFIGKVVDVLKCSQPNLVVIDNLFDCETFSDIIYTDSLNNEWDSTMIIALILRKLYSDIKIFDDAKIEAIAVTLPSCSNEQQKIDIKNSFEILNLPFTQCIDNAIAACWGYEVDIDNEQNIIVFDWSSNNTELSLLKFNANELEILKKLNIPEINERVFLKKIRKIIQKQFYDATNTEIEETDKNIVYLNQLVDEILKPIIENEKPLGQTLCVLNGSAVEIVISRVDIKTALADDINHLASSIEDFLSNNNESTDILITGQSLFFFFICQTLNNIIDQETAKVHCITPDEILAKGTSFYLKQNKDKLIINKKTEDNEEIAKLKSFITSIEINVGTDVLS